MYDAVVVGGGPAGTVAARSLAKDRNILVLEEHPVSGIPTQCAGLVTADTIGMTKVSPNILNTINNADVIFPNGKVFEVRSDSIASVIDRADLDSKLAADATDKGAEIRYNTKYLKHSITKDCVKIDTQNGTICARSIIGADGHSSKISDSIPNNQPKEYIYGICADIRMRSEQPDTMNLRLGSDIAPGFFSWEIPAEDITRVGVCIKKGTGTTPNDHLKKLIKTIGAEDKDTIAKYSGKIPIGGKRRTYGERTLLIGDAAGQVKPISGGGLYPIFRSVPVLADVLRECLDKDDLSERALSKYEKGWKQQIGKELSRGYSIRKVYTKLSDDDMNKLFDIINNERARKILNDINLDNPSNVVKPMLKETKMIFGAMPIILRALL